MKKTPKKNAGKKASELITKCDKLEEPVTNSCLASDQRSSGDQSKEAVAICDQLDNEVEIIPIEEIDIAKLIVVVRSQQVLIDRDLAMLYHVETKVLNQKVKRNIARFPERYRFQLTKDEMQELVTNCDRFKSLNIQLLHPMLSQNRGYLCSLLFFPAKRLLIQVSELWMLLLVCVAICLQMLTSFSALIIWKCNNLRTRNGRNKQTRRLTSFLIRWMPTPPSF